MVSISKKQESAVIFFMFPIMFLCIILSFYLIAGNFWSFGALVVRYIDCDSEVQWQYLFTRGLVIFIILNKIGFLNISGIALHPLVSVIAKLHL